MWIFVNSLINNPEFDSQVRLLLLPSVPHTLFWMNRQKRLSKVKYHHLALDAILQRDFWKKVSPHNVSFSLSTSVKSSGIVEQVLRYVSMKVVISFLWSNFALIIRASSRWTKWAERNVNDSLASTSTAFRRQASWTNGRLIDANNAGTKKSIDCTLILTEGDSAKVNLLRFWYLDWS